MRLETITIKGVLAFPEAVTVDLRDLPPGIVAIVGAIGQGKTTFLESPLAGLLREFPSREKEVVKYALGRDAFIDQTFSLDGQGVFRGRLNLDGEKGQSDAQLSRILADGSTLALSDGKVTTYDAAIAQLLPPMRSWLASVFSSQNRKGSFASCTKAERKALFGSFLGLDAYDEWADRAGRAAALVATAIAGLQARRELLARDASADLEAQLHADGRRVAQQLEQVQDRRGALQRDLDAIDRELATLQTAAAAHAASLARLDRVLVDIETAAAERTSALAALERLTTEEVTERDVLTSSLRAALESFDRRIADRSTRDAERKTLHADLVKALADLDERIANNSQILLDATSIRASAAAFTAAEQAIERHRAEERAAGEDVQASDKRVRGVMARVAVVAEREAALERARKAAQGLATVPFGEDCAPCHFMATAAAAKAEIPGLEEACAERSAVDADFNAAGAAARAAELQLEAIRASLREAEQDRERVKKQAGRLPNLEHAKDRIAELEKAKAEQTAAAERLTAAADAREVERQKGLVGDRAAREQQHQEQRATLAQRIVRQREETAGRVDALARRSTELLGERDTLRDELAATQDASQRAAAQTALLVLRRHEWDASTQTLTSLQHQWADLEQRVAAVRARGEELAGVDAAIARHAQDRREWEQLAKALGRDGLQTLEIDAAGPTVSAFTNDLLQSCFGPRFTVELVTQAEKATKGKDGSTHKEVFDLKVYDNEKGGAARDLTDLSGGQQVLVDEALKSAIALLVNQRNRSPIRTLFRDETTGSLDHETAMRYVAMLRRVRELGGFHHALFITHNEEASLAADAIIRVENGTVALLQPPFTNEAAAA